MKYQEPVCHAMGVTRSVNTGTLPSPCCSAETKLRLQTRFCKLLFSKQDVQMGARNQASYSENQTLKRCLVFLNLMSEFTIHQVLKTSKVFKDFFPRKTNERLSGSRRVPIEAGSEQAFSMHTSTSPSALLDVRQLCFLKGNSQECIHLTGTTQSCCSIYLVTFLFKYFFKNNFLPLKLSKNIYIPRQLNNFKMVYKRKNYT